MTRAVTPIGSGRTPAARAAARDPVLPLTPSETLTDDALIDLGAARPAGLSEEDIAALVMYLPDLCAELIAWRAGRSVTGMLETLAGTITNRRLFDLGHGGPERAMGEISDDDRRFLYEYLPAICSELLIWRAMERGAYKPDAANSGGGDCSTLARFFQSLSRPLSPPTSSPDGMRGRKKSTPGTSAPAKTFANCADQDQGPQHDPITRAQFIAVVIVSWIAILAVANAGLTQ